MDLGRKTTAAVGMAMLAAFMIPAGSARAQSQDQSDAPDAPHTRFGNPTSIARIYQTYVFGIVEKADKSDWILGKTKFGGNQDFKITKATKFIRNGKRSTPFTPKPGEMVWIDMKRNKKTGEMIAKKVVVGIAATGGPSTD